MRKYLFMFTLLCPGICLGGPLSDAIKGFVEKSKMCDEITLQIKQAEENSDSELVKKLQTEFNEKQCHVKEVDGTGGANGDETKNVQPEEPHDLKCEDGTPPDEHGCCTGEIYTDMGIDGFNCCPQSDGDCFPPLK